MSTHAGTGVALRRFSEPDSRFETTEISRLTRADRHRRDMRDVILADLEFLAAGRDAAVAAKQQDQEHQQDDWHSHGEDAGAGVSPVGPHFVADLVADEGDRAQEPSRVSRR
jgi:hypothetical protein